MGYEKRPKEEKIVENTTNLQFSREDTPVSLQAIREYLALLWAAYQEASRNQKSKILDEIERNLSVHRGTAKRYMSGKEPPKLMQGKGGGRNTTYGEEARNWLKVLWWEMGHIGAKKMNAALKRWLSKYDNPLCSEEVKKEIGKMSSSTIERSLKNEKADLRRKLNTGTRRSKNFTSKIPLRDIDFSPEEPGYCEIDCVAHCGGTLSGEFSWTLTLTDIVVGWTASEAIWGKNGFTVCEALRKIEERIPFKIVCLYVDNGSEFLNRDLIKFINKEFPCRVKPIQLERSRPKRKNDQCYVEQKNYTHVRQLFGNHRIGWKKQVGMMNAIYRNEWEDLQNYFYPQQRLLEKYRKGSKWIRKMEKELKTPYERLLPFLDDLEKIVLEAKYEKMNPFELRRKQRKKLNTFYLYFEDKVPINERGKFAI